MFTTEHKPGEENTVWVLSVLFVTVIYQKDTFFLIFFFCFYIYHYDDTVSTQISQCCKITANIISVCEHQWLPLNYKYYKSNKGLLKIQFMI